ncbi:MAG TPA: hypothetical protein VFR31_22795 [Thermoanaerobaculia bacterium]|nr:hypothetical protein [Thermoanaerobaculia bacterium]
MRFALLFLLAWIRVDSDHFTLLSNAGERPTLRLAADLERLRATLARLDPDLELPSPLVFVFKDEESYSPYRLVLDGKTVDADGYLLARPEGSFMVIKGDARSVVYHEYLHDVLHRNYPGLPLWLHEGMAQLYSGPLEEHALWLRKNRLLPVSELFSMDVHSKDYHEGERRGVFYAQTWVLAHYLLLGNRRERTLHYLRNPSDETFRTAFGGDLDAELLAYVRRGAFIQVPMPAGPTESDFRVAPVPQEELLASLDLLRSRREQKPKQEEDLLQAAEKLIEQGDLEGAIPLLEQAGAKERLAEVREALEYNRFGERYDEAVRLSEAGKTAEAIRILEELAANAPTPGQADQARRLLEELRRK